MVSALKPSDDGQALIVRLFGASGENQKVTLKWSDPAPQAMWLSDTSEKAGTPLNGPIEVPGYGIVTVRAAY